MDTEARKSQTGFTLIELMVVIAIIAVLVGMLTPAVQKVRQTANEADATDTLRSVVGAQQVFSAEDSDGDGAPDYAESIAQLVEAGLIDGFDDEGVKSGYQFDMIAGPVEGLPGGPLYSWNALAKAVSLARSGDQSFYANETGIVQYVPCPPGQQPAFVNGQVQCLPVAVPAGPIGGSMGIASMDAANLISGGAALPAAQDALPDLVDMIVEEFDADGDTQVSWQEMLSADILAMAQHIAGSLQPEGAPRIAGDELLAFILDAFQVRLAQDAALHATETAVPKVAIAGLTGHPEAIAELVSPSLPFGSLNVLEGLVDSLDPDPTAGQMTAPDEDTNAQHKALMLGSVGKMPALLRFKRLERLTKTLLELRSRTDGVPAMDDWVAGESAAQITAQVDKTLGLIHSL